MLPEPVEPEPQPPEPGPPTGTPCERACVRYAELACTPVLELPECAAECDKMEAFAIEIGARIGWNPECQVGAADCAAWAACRGDGT